MPGTRPAAEVRIDATLVRRLVAVQFPRWASLAVAPVDSAGWDNTIFRLGSRLAARLPRRRIGAEQVGKEHRWLPWTGHPVWMHGDLHPANLLVERHELSAVIDFGLLGVGDPACDLMVAWTYLPADSRDAFRGAVAFDDAMWSRGRGWALRFGLRAAAYSADNRVLGDIGRYTVAQVLADFE
jgi:aminoglycoside phosphotransferase (APT) family kinase protein